ncbi:ribose 5-phosphate isomerase B [Candidatus Peregrinibacteria bacterium]|jgi:ribose 5-phosphate isomerase B|nr:ribose 5-phosphate isomerase B [Candidatus Peregrinibacteria bacterium]MBT4631692.1 ribose 5-phosphate isomerase B [Candidatus Peregrinibacteria bacterium]MBT5517217.1 ribose 5-phosphate isomerase B [Candidatus Peregrinibacteria bacterium]MBT5824245.1 ribose 5-phosphate isomerase B [Candidatus Peregrinibacteria bacterium]
MQIYLGSDHAGYGMKEVVQTHLKDAGHEVLDLGVFDEVNKADYPDIAREVGEKVLENADSLGVLVCGTGMGMALAANKLKGIRAVTAHDSNTARMAREHNNANVITFGQRVIGNDVAKEIVDTFLGAEFEGGRHGRRVDKITAIENA